MMARIVEAEMIYIWIYGYMDIWRERETQRERHKERERGRRDHLDDRGGRPLGLFCKMTWERVISDPIFLLFGCCERVTAAAYSCFSFAGRERRR